MASSRAEEQPLLDRVQHLELELNLLKSQLSDWQHLRTSCEQVSACVRRLLPEGSSHPTLSRCFSVAASTDRYRDMNRDQKKPSGVTFPSF